MKKGQIVAAAAVWCMAVAATQAQVGVDVALSGAGVFPKSTSSSTSNVSNDPTNSAAVFGSIGYGFNQHHGIELNLGHTNNSQIFTLPPDTYRVKTGIFEFTAAYVFTPLTKGRWSPFLLAGGGALGFSVDGSYIDTLPTDLGAVRQTRLAVLYGAGTNYRIWGRLGLRLQYRGLIFRAPDFDVPSRFYTGARGHMAEPAVGIVVKF
jgi:opacity protein-like surface antigen